MFSQKWLLLLGLSVLFVGCSTNNYLALHSSAYRDNSPRNIGVRYLLGQGVKQNDEKAFYYFHQAALEGDAFAQNEVAYLYAAGKGTAKNNALAFSWYQKAAQQNLVSAQYNLGLFYLHGIGTTPNKALAMEWFQQSAARGFQPAKTALERL